MSIPPLVCSTPPPPDQCEEDKDPDDFDISYNLSQDDDDDDSLGYGDFSSYNHYQSNCVAQEKKTNFKAEKELSIHDDEQVDVSGKNQLESKEERHSPVSTVDESKPKSEEDTNIEDLCLEVNEVSVSSSEKEDDPSESENLNVDSENLSCVVSTTDTTQDASETNEKQSNPSSNEIVVDTTRTEQDKESSDDGLIEEPSIDLDNQSSEPNSSSTDEVCKNDLNIEENIEAVQETNLDNSFGDFDDFQFVNKETKVSEVIENCDNPWDTNVSDDNDDFGNFTANFESIEEQNSSPNVDINADQEHQDSNSIDDDDFGDFDDFKSSAVDNDVRELSLQSGSDQSLPVLNFQASDSEHQVTESITKVLTSVFGTEISEPESKFEGRLETMLSETWGHLRETDVRQPYIINWNNSLGQKTLLRALCIDSRNILFGPKWGYNMPKYAVNLSAAPLQPQKPLTPSNPSQSETVPEKTTPKPSQGGWTDPFTADGQEFTYAEALLLDLEHLMATLDQMAHNHSSLKISELLSQACNTESESVVEVTATDLDVFEAAISSKPDKIYSSTLNVQPLRQISLPDTHIFTPTDSETPTSKTVHYDSGPPILLPQNSLEGKQAESSTAQESNDTSKDDDDYWDFQDFKSGTDKSVTTAPTVSAPKTDPLPETKTASNPAVTYQTQVLQPIRMEPLIPTVNWPDPGEIKETFDDFSDFVSNSAWSDKSREDIPIPATENKSTVETDVLDKINDKHKTMEEISRSTIISYNQDFDDDFDTFQSALPPKHIVPEFNFDNLGKLSNIPPQNSTQIDFQNAFPKNNVKSEIISVSNPMRPNEALAVNQGTVLNSSSRTSPASSHSMHPSLLQPMPASSNLSSQSKQKTGQILQPLSLESYSQINWPNPGIDLQDLSRFNPVETLQSLKSDLSVGGSSKGSSPIHNHKNAVNNQVVDDDWGEFVSSKPKQQPSATKKPASFVDDDEWTDFVSSPSVKPQNGLNTISLNVHTNSNIQKSSNSKFSKNNQLPLDIPSLNYITPKASGHSSYNDRHFQNL